MNHRIAAAKFQNKTDAVVHLHLLLSGDAADSFSFAEQLVHHTSHFGFPPRRKSKMVWAFGAHPGVYPAIPTYALSDIVIK